jgi:FixJ family two-component response regulator
MHIDLARVSIVEADVTARRELAALIQSAGWQVECFASAQEFLSQPRTLAPGCLILDVMLQDMSGLELQTRLAPRCELPIIFCTYHREISISVQAMKAGALEFLTKPICPQSMLRAVETAIGRSTAAIANESNLQALRLRYGSLSAREREVMALVVSGRLNKLIAADLDISEVTVKAHRGRMMRKMSARSVPHLVTMAARLAQDLDQGTSLPTENAWFAYPASTRFINDVLRPLTMAMRI